MHLISLHMCVQGILFIDALSVTMFFIHVIGNKILAIERQLNHIYKCVEICQFQSKALNVQGEKRMI